MRNKLFKIFILLFTGFLTCSEVYGKSPGHPTVDASDKGITILENKNYFTAVLNHIDNAQHEILVSMYVFKTNGKRTNYADRIKDALISASKRGVDVRVLLEWEYERGSSLNADNEKTAITLDRGGVKVYFDSPTQRTHVKAVVIDRRYTFIGSHNLTSSALQYNNELSLMIESVETAQEAVRYIEGIIERGKK